MSYSKNPTLTFYLVKTFNFIHHSLTKVIILLAIISSLLACISITSRERNRVIEYKYIDTSASASNWNPDAPWKLAIGYSQTLVSNESNLNIYDQTRNDLPDMMTVNETGEMAGRFLYRTHEHRLPKSLPVGGSISVIDLVTGETKLLAHNAKWNAVDGIRWTPWKTLIFGEEVSQGRLFEIYLSKDMMSVTSIHERSAVGQMAHEGIEVDAQGNIYVVDEYPGQSAGCHLYTAPCGGGIYKFVPAHFGDLSSGYLYVLKVSNEDGTGQGEWVGPIDPKNVRLSGSAVGGQSYQRPEDLEIIDDTLYVAITEGPTGPFLIENYESRVLAINLRSLRVTDFVKPGMNVPEEIGKPGQFAYRMGFDGVDNLAESPDGQLMMIEDNNPSDIWIASTKKINQLGASEEVHLFASLADPKAEGTGIYFSPMDPDTLYVNIQHSAIEDGDGTWAITKDSFNR